MYHHPLQTIYRQPRGTQKNSAAGEERENLITSHLSKVKYIADRMAEKLPPTVEREDLYSAGVVGLIDAVERFDASLGVAFTTFAEMRVRGAILDSLRSLDWASRSTRKRARELQKAFAETEQELGRAATPEEVAKKMQITINELHENLREMHGLMLANLDDRDEKTGLSLAETIFDTKSAPHNDLEKTQQSLILAKAIEALPDRERQVIALYYLEELTMKEIGKVLDITESRVSQLRTQAIIRLRNKLAK